MNDVISAPADVGASLREATAQPAVVDGRPPRRSASGDAARGLARGFSLVVSAFLLFALLRGGSSADVVAAGLVKLGAIPVLAFALWRIVGIRPAAGARLPGLVFLGALALGLLQLVPLPPAVWTALPGRDVVVAGYQAASMALPWAPVSLTPAATWAAITGLLPAAAIFTAMLTLDARGQRWAIGAALLAAVASIGLGVLQLAGGEASSWRLYAFTDATAAVGAFANRNHQGVFLAAILPLAAMVATAGRAGPGPPRAFWIALGFALAVMAAVGVAAAKSRAGVLLAAPGALGAILVALGRARGEAGRSSWMPAATLLGATLAAAGLVLAFSFTPLAGRFETSLDRDLRHQLTPLAMEAGRTFAPVGAGLGAFPSVYPMFEPPRMVSEVFVNHAHNDYAELWLEAGVPGLALVGLFVLWWAARTLGLLRTGSDPQTAQALAGGVIVGILLIHSAVDYPLRTPALATFFAFACALLVGPVRSDRSSKSIADR